MDDQSSGEIKRAHRSDPTTGAPYPMCDRVVNQGRPEQREYQVRRELHALDNRARQERDSEDRDHHLVRHEKFIGNQGHNSGLGWSPTPHRQTHCQPPHKPANKSGPNDRLYPMTTHCTHTNPSNMKLC